MLFDSKAKDYTRFFSLHIELIMWGDDFLDIDADNPAEPIVKWLSLCDGGTIENEGSKSISKETFDRIIDYIYSIDFPDREDDEMNLRWEISTHTIDAFCRILECDVEDIMEYIPDSKKK